MLGKKRFIVTTVCFALLGCGGGSSDPESTIDNNSSNAPTVLTGVFVDSAVEGVAYDTQTQTGTTNAQGQFNYIAGEEVTFSIGSTELPTVTAAAQVSPVDMAVGSSNPEDTTTNIARLLQSLDTDGDPDNGITISNSAAQTPSSIDFNVSVVEFENDIDVINLVANSGSVNTSLISAENANTHLDETLGVNDVIEDETGGFAFTQASLENRYFIPVLENFANGFSAYRINQSSVLTLADIGDTDGILRFGDFPWSVDSDSNFVADFSQLNPPSMCAYDLQSINDEILSVNVSCSNFDEPFNGEQYHLSKPLSVSDFAGKSWDLDNGGRVEYLNDGTGSLQELGETRSFTYAASSLEAVEVTFSNGETSEIVLVQGSIDDGLFIIWDFNSDGRFINIEYSFDCF